MPCGTLSLLLTHPRYQDHASETVLLPYQGNQLRIRMKRPRITLRVQSTPAKVTVTINRKKVGRSPVKRKIDAFESVEVRVEAPDVRPSVAKPILRKTL
ncbi:MAG: PEGA domain-containing protein [Myxococcales bacterium]|nr:PEGA domain-containing protein [Myxococcales bacterium]